MKTYEQVASTVLERRDRYLEAQAKKRKAARKYSAAGLMVLVAVVAAAVLLRSGLFDPGSKTTDRTGTAVSEETLSSRTRPSREESGGVQTEAAGRSPAPTAAASQAAHTTQTTENTGSKPSRAAETTAAAQPRTTATRTAQETTVPRATEPTTKKTDAPPSVITGETTGKEPLITKAPTADPENTSTQAPAAEKTVRTLYLMWDGKVYYAEMAEPSPVPSGAGVLGQKQAAVIDDCVIDDLILESPGFLVLENHSLGGETYTVEHTQLTFLELPTGDPAAEIGVQLPGSNEMYVLTCTAEEPDKIDAAITF